MKLSGKTMARIERFRRSKRGPALTSADARVAVALLRSIGDGEDLRWQDPNLPEVVVLFEFAGKRNVAGFLLDRGVQGDLQRELLIRLHGVAKAARQAKASPDKMYAALDRLPPGAGLGDFRRTLARQRRARQEREDLAARARKALDGLAPCQRSEAVAALVAKGWARATAYRATVDWAAPN